jgi:flagellar FlgN protein
VTALAPQAQAATQVGAAILHHLDEQLASTRRLLEHVLRQGQAVRARRVDEVLTVMAEIQGEMERRGRMDRDRTAILTHAGARLGIAPHQVTLDAMSGLLSAAEAPEARRRSAELRGLLAEVAREHAVNRALMKQELSFLDHLTRLMGGGGGQDGGYRPPGETRGAFAAAPLSPRPSALRALDLQA